MNQREYRELMGGEKVKVSRAISNMERQLLGRVFSFSRLTVPHEMAVIADEHGVWWVHPECLELCAE